MSKVISRLAVFFIGIPIVIGLVFINVFNHLPLHLVIALASTIAALEICRIFESKIKLLSKALIICCSSLIPLVTGFSYVLPAFTGKPFPIDNEIITYALIVSFLLVLGNEVFTAKTFEHSNERLSASFFIIVYSGYLITFISRMSQFKKMLPDSSGNLVLTDVSFQFITCFLLMVFMCDSIAWLFGVTMGKNNRGIVKASPNKSIAGFIGGFIGSVAAGLLSYFIWPDTFNGSVIKIIIVSIIIAGSSIIGDLAESVMKRSADYKDSGSIVPGRGGVLDSIDSIVMSAPIFYLLVKILYSPIL